MMKIPLDYTKREEIGGGLIGIVSWALAIILFAWSLHWVITKYLP